MKILKNVAFCLGLILLSACSGTGVKDYSYVAPVINSDVKGKVFVHRDSGWIGGGALFTVTVNGATVGQLGAGEMLIADAKTGSNLVQATVTGIQGVGLNSPSSEFQNDGTSNNFFILSLKSGLFKNEMTLMETTEGTWKAQTQ
jgi:hypothetical protein